MQLNIDHEQNYLYICSNHLPPSSHQHTKKSCKVIKKCPNVRNTGWKKKLENTFSKHIKLVYVKNNKMDPSNVTTLSQIDEVKKNPCNEE